MKIAVLTDIHSNCHSLEAVLNDITTEHPDVVVGAGDMVGCSAYPGTAKVWNLLHGQNIPFVLGNEEDRILRWYAPGVDSYLKNSVQYLPLRFRAAQFSVNDIEVMKTLPVNIVLDGPHGQDVLVCHASPGNLHRSPMHGIDADMEQDLDAVHAQVIVVGHLHTVWHHYWRGKLLVMAGSGGLPLRGKVNEVDYVVLTYHKQAWRFTYKTVYYDSLATIKEAAESGFLEQAGPIGWLMFDEILTQEDRVTSFLETYCPKDVPDDIEHWKRLVLGYLEHIGRWDAVKPYVQHVL